MKIRFSLALFFAFAVVPIAGTLNVSQSCGLKIAAVAADPSDTTSVVTFPNEEEPLKGYSAYAIDIATSTKYPSVLSDGVRYFGEIPAGKYRVYVSMPEFKTTTQPVELICKDEKISVTGFVKLWRGSSKETVEVSETAPLVMRLDRITRLGSTDRAVELGGLSTASNGEQTISGGVLNGKAISLAKPTYPAAARAERAGGTVTVQVVIDGGGNVIAASAVSGHPLLKEASESAARTSKFSPTLLQGMPVKVSGVIVYNFIP